MLLEDLENSVNCKNIERRNTTDSEKRPGTIEYRETQTIEKYFGHNLVTASNKFEILISRNQKLDLSRIVFGFDQAVNRQP